MLIDTLSWWVRSRYRWHWTLWWRLMSISIVLYISYTLIGTTTEPRPHTTRIILLTGTIDRKTLFLWWWRCMVVSTVQVMIMFFVSALVVCPITILVPCDTRIHKCAGSINERAHSWSRCEVIRDQWTAARWCGVGAASSTVVLSCAVIHPLLALLGGNCTII